MKKNGAMKIVNMIAFGMLLLGGLNFLFMGLFGFNLFGAIFGESVVARVIYALFGVSAVILMLEILWKAFMGKTPVKEVAKDIAKTVAQKSEAATNA